MARMQNLPRVNTYKRNNTWTCSFELERVNGKRTQKTKGGFRTEEEARIAGEKLRNQIYLGGEVIRNKSEDYISVNDFIFNIWFPKRCKVKNWDIGTQKSYTKTIKNYIIPVIGKYPINTLTPEILQDLLDEMYYKKRYSRNTVSNVHSLLLSILKYAHNHDYIDKFYFDEFVIPKKDEDSAINRNTQKRDVIPEEALDKIFKRFPEGTSSFLPMAIALYTGARLGEAFALTFEACDFEKNTIRIQRQMPYGTTETVCNPKYNSVRTVPMCKTLKELLLRAKQKRDENEKVWGENYCHTYLIKRADSPEYKNLHGFYDICYEGENEVHFVNVTERGELIYPSVMKYASRIIHGFSSNKKKKERGTPLYADYNTHSLRHTFVSVLRSEGVDDITLSCLTGHKGNVKEGASKTTLTYIHPLLENNQELIDKIDSIYRFKTDLSS